MNSGVALIANAVAIAAGFDVPGLCELYHIGLAHSICDVEASFAAA
jgi:hypothetical protein